VPAAGPDFDAAADDVHLRTTPVRALVASDIRLYREGLAAGLAGSGRVEVTGTAADAATAVKLAHELAPDVVLVDLVMAGWEEAVRAVAGTDAEPRVVVLGVREEEDEVIACAEAGVSGYVTREASLDELTDVVEGVSRGESPCSPRISALLLRRVAETAGRRPKTDTARRLTRREAEIVGLIDEGLSNKQIAGRLSIELATVKNHVHSILEKLQVERRAEAAARVRSLQD
jgi:two-component system, NarL family, nitrate/nitrite response regulator NarL